MHKRHKSSSPRSDSLCMVHMPHSLVNDRRSASIMSRQDLAQPFHPLHNTGRFSTSPEPSFAEPTKGVDRWQIVWYRRHIPTLRSRLSWFMRNGERFGACQGRAVSGVHEAWASVISWLGLADDPSWLKSVGPGAARRNARWLERATWLLGGGEAGRRRPFEDRGLRCARGTLAK